MTELLLQLVDEGRPAAYAALKVMALSSPPQLLPVHAAAAWSGKDNPPV